MAIYYCPKCNKKYFLDDETQFSKEFQLEFKCEFCGTSYKGIQSATSKVNNVEQEKNDNHVEEPKEKFVSPQMQSNTAEMELLLKIERKQLETLESIRSMLKFFFVLTIIGLVCAIAIPLLGLV